MTSQTSPTQRRTLATFTLTCLLVTSGWQTAWADAAPRVKFATSEGDFVVEVYPEKAPKTVENFLQYVKDKHYDGTIFHRVINNFMVQGGGFDAKYVEKPGRAPVRHEGQEALAKGGDKNTVGTLAMARTSDPHSATAQFFINYKDNTFLNHTGKNASGWGYAVFGEVIEGMDVVDAMAKEPTGNHGGHQDVPKKNIIIDKAEIINP